MTQATDQVQVAANFGNHNSHKASQYHQRTNKPTLLVIICLKISQSLQIDSIGGKTNVGQKFPTNQSLN